MGVTESGQLTDRDRALYTPGPSRFPLYFIHGQNYQIIKVRFNDSKATTTRPLPFFIRAYVVKQKHKNLFISNDMPKPHTSHSRRCRFGFTRPPPSTLVTWATVPFRRPENPSWRPCQNRTRRRQDSSCRAGLSIGPYPSASQDRRSHP